MRFPWQSRQNESTNMAIGFPNRSRSYDATRHAVHFWGHDRSMESSFYVSMDALKRLQPDLEPVEASILQAFDRHMDRIHEIAARIYARGRRGSYDLNAGDI